MPEFAAFEFPSPLTPTPGFAVAGAVVVDGADEAPANLPPRVENVAPAEGTAVRADGVVGFDTVDAEGFRRVAVHAHFPTGWEVVHDGDGFAPAYATGSTLEEVEDAEVRLRFRLRRAGGWPAAPVLKVLAVDAGGEEA